MKTLSSVRDTLDHEVRNAIAGVVLETRVITKALKRLQTYLDRIDEACSTCLAQMETHLENSIIEKKED